MRPRGYWTEETCLADARLYQTKTEWHKKSGSGYVAAKGLGCFEKCVEHMPKAVIARATALTHKQYVQRVHEALPDIEVVGEYTRAHDFLNFRCEYGHEWEAKAYSVMQGHGCPHCAGKAKVNMLDWIEQHRPDLTLLSETKGRVELKCGCGHAWETNSAAVRNGGTGCSKCAPKGSDNNVFYIWSVAGSPGLYKIGVTSERCDEERVNVVANQHEMTPNIVMMLKRERATEVEAVVLELGDDPCFDAGIDGSTEFRILTDQELGEAVSIAYSMAA